MKPFDGAGAKLIGSSVDSAFALKTWATAMGGIRHPLLAEPRGGGAQSLGFFGEEAGVAQRTLFIIDPQGVVRHSELHTRTLPDVAAALAGLRALQGRAAS